MLTWIDARAGAVVKSQKIQSLELLLARRPNVEGCAELAG
jgi:hypothetical protein